MAFFKKIIRRLHLDVFLLISFSLGPTYLFYFSCWEDPFHLLFLLYDLPFWPFYPISCFDVFHLATLLRKVPNSVWKKILEFDQLTMTEGCEIKNDPRLFYLFCLNFKIQTQ